MIQGLNFTDILYNSYGIYHPEVDNSTCKKVYLTKGIFLQDYK